MIDRRLFGLIPYICLFSLSLAPIYYSFELNLWSIIRSGLIATGLFWLLRRQASGKAATSLVFNPLFLALVLVYVIAQHGSAARLDDFFIYSLVPALVFLATASLIVAKIRAGQTGHLVSRLSKADKAVALSAVLLLANNLLIFFVVSDYYEDTNLRIQSFRLLELVVSFAVYFVVSRLDWDITKVWNSPATLLWLTAAVCCLAFFLGIYRIGGSTYYAEEATKALEQEEYKRFWEVVDRLYLLNDRLGINRHTLDVALVEYAGIVEQNTEPHIGYEILGNLCMDHRYWGGAVAMYEKALVGNKKLNDTYRKLGDAFYEIGLWYDAIHAYEQGMAIDSLDIKTRSSLVAVQIKKLRTKRGELYWQNIQTIVEGDIAKFDLPTNEHRGEDIHFRRLSEILDKETLEPLEKLSIEEVAYLMTRLGYSVRFNTMEIGSTGITTPVDIMAYSAGGGDWAPEKILVNGRDVSPPMKGSYSNFRRGYNLVIVDPRSGAVEDSVNYDIWGARHTSPDEMADFIAAIPDGKIVIATVRGDVGMFLTDRAIRALNKIGAVRAPAFRWSHAIIGVKGAARGTALEEITQDSHILLGVLKSPSPDLKTNSEIRKAIEDSLRGRPDARAAIYLVKPISESIIASRGLRSKKEGSGL